MTNIKVGIEAKQLTFDATQYNPEDPYDTPDEHAETKDFIFNTFFGWTGAGGTFSTWRERHIFLNGFYSGFRTKLQDKFEDIPSMWKNEQQYYQFGQEAGYVIRNAFIFALAGSVGTEVAINSGTILTLLRGLIGM